jgi:hypothetical protein
MAMLAVDRGRMWSGTMVTTVVTLVRVVMDFACDDR